MPGDLQDRFTADPVNVGEAPASEIGQNNGTVLE